MLYHAYTQTVSDGTATSVVRPSDWNSGHIESRRLSGNTLGASTISGLDLVFVGGNNITVSADTAAGKIVFSGANTSAGVGLSAGTNSTNAGTVIFADSNGVSFGMDTNGQITATVRTNYQSAGAYLTTAMQSNAATISNINVSAGTTSNNLSALTFNNSNGVSFGLNGSVITATVATNYQSQGAYLTTARASNDAVGLATAQSNVTWTVNSAGLSLDARGYAGTGTTTAGANIGLSVTQNSNGLNVSATVAAQSVQPVAASGSNGSFAFSTVTFGNLNGLSHYTSNGSIVGSYTVPSTAGLLSNINVSAGTTSNNLSALTFSNSNGITFGLNASTITASHNGLTTARASNDAVGLNTALTAGPLAWTVNSSGISLNASNAAGTTSGFGGNLISGSMTHNTAGLNLSLNHPAWLTTARASNDAIGLNTAQSNVTWTVNSAGLSLDARGYAGTGTSATNASVTLNSNGIAISVAAGGGAGDGYNSAQFTNSTANSTMPILWAGNSNGSGNLTMGLTGSTVTASFSVPSTAGLLSAINVSAGTTSNNLSAVTFGNANGITFGLNAGTVTASHNGLTTARASTDAIGLNTAQSNVTWTVNSAGLSFDARGYAGTGTTFNGANISGSMTVNSAGVQLSLSGNAGGGGGGGIAAAAGTQTATSGTVVFSNSNGMVFGMSNSSVITASYNDVTESLFWRPNDIITTVGAPIVNSASVVYCPMDHNLSASRFDLLASVNVATTTNNSSAGFLYSITAVLYTLNGGTLSSVSSATTNNQMTWTSNATGSVTGGFYLSAPLNVAAAADKYWVGVQLSTRATGLTGAATTSLGNTVSILGVGSAILGAFSVREPGANTANSAGWIYGMGMYSGTSNFSTIALSNLTQQGTNMQRANVALRMLNL